jgi:hypothetical protein
MPIDDAKFMAWCWTSKLSWRRSTKSFRNGLRGRPVCEYAAFNRELRTISSSTFYCGYSSTGGYSSNDGATPLMSCQKANQENVLVSETGQTISAAGYSRLPCIVTSNISCHISNVVGFSTNLCLIGDALIRRLLANISKICLR